MWTEWEIDHSRDNGKDGFSLSFLNYEKGFCIYLLLDATGEGLFTIYSTRELMADYPSKVEHKCAVLSARVISLY
jgi:hypothetical protein